jgi:hypothetical protein
VYAIIIGNSDWTVPTPHCLSGCVYYVFLCEVVPVLCEGVPLAINFGPLDHQT